MLVVVVVLVPVPVVEELTGTIFDPVPRVLVEVVVVVPGVTSRIIVSVQAPKVRQLAMTTIPLMRDEYT